MEKIISQNFFDLLVPNIEIKNFPDRDVYVRIENAAALSGKDVDVYHRLYPDQNSSLIQAIFIAQALKNANAKNIKLIAPYLPYSRQDKITLEGEVKSSEIITNLLKFAGYSCITTFDCHFLKKEGEFEYGGIKIKNISLSSLLIKYAKNKLGENFEIVSPDAGANYMSNGKSMKKIRGEYNIGNIIYRDIKKMEIDFDVKGKSILVIDDMISTGSTIIKAVENLRNNGAGRIAIAATHGFFLGDSLERLGSLCDYIVTSNTIQQTGKLLQASATSGISKVNFMSMVQ